MEPPPPPPPPSPTLSPKGTKRSLDGSQTSNPGLSKLRQNPDRVRRAKEKKAQIKLLEQCCLNSQQAAKSALEEIYKENPARSTIDKDHLFAHMKRAHQHKTRFNDRIKDSKAKLNKLIAAGEDTKEVKDKISGDKGEVTEGKGEFNTGYYMATAHPELSLFTGFAAGTGFDQIWVQRDQGGITKIVIVEAKGPNAKLQRLTKKEIRECSGKPEQMDIKWVVSNIEKLENSIKKRKTKESKFRAFIDKNDITFQKDYSDEPKSSYDFELNSVGRRQLYYRTKKEVVELIALMKNAILGKPSPPCPKLVGMLVGMDGKGKTGAQSLPPDPNYPKRDGADKYCYNGDHRAMLKNMDTSDD